MDGPAPAPREERALLPLLALAGLVLPGPRLPSVRAALLARLGRVEEARDSFEEALALCGNAAEAEHLAGRLADL